MTGDTAGSSFPSLCTLRPSVSRLTAPGGRQTPLRAVSDSRLCGPRPGPAGVRGAYRAASSPRLGPVPGSPLSDGELRSGPPAVRQPGPPPGGDGRWSEGGTEAGWADQAPR